MATETGATPEQIEAAVERRASASGWAKSDQDIYRPKWRDEAGWHAMMLVPPGYRIVGPGGVWLDDEQAATAREARDGG